MAPAEPKTVLDALQQRLNRYREAGVQARAKGDERKARMHDRIAKQYQDAVRTQLQAIIEAEATEEFYLLACFQ